MMDALRYPADHSCAPEDKGNGGEGQAPWTCGPSEEGAAESGVRMGPSSIWQRRRGRPWPTFRSGVTSCWQRWSSSSEHPKGSSSWMGDDNGGEGDNEDHDDGHDRGTETVRPVAAVVLPLV